jgi:hypothetical protein
MTSEPLRRIIDGVLVAGEYTANAVVGLLDPRLRALGIKRRVEASTSRNWVRHGGPGGAGDK